jgi:cysteine desulfuration protein SufE
MAVTPAANEAALREAFLPVRDPHERLALITDACSGPGLPPEARREADLVPGCVSQVWLSGAVVDGVLQLRWDAASPLVRGLAGLICQVYDGAAIAGIPGYQSRLLTDLGLDRQLSPTRLRGLAAVEARIHGLGVSPA